MKVEVILEGAGVGKNGAKVQIVQDYCFTHPRTKLCKMSL
jgi:hypothetical protein